MIVNEELVEILADKVHGSWAAEKQRQGFANHTIEQCHAASNPDVCWTPKDKHHPDMLPYADLPEHVKQYDRVTVRGVLDGIAAAGYRVVPAE